MLSGYFDDSGTHDDSQVIVWAGFIGSECQWATLDSAWALRLLEPLAGKSPLKKFHMSDCEARTGEFRGYSLAEKDAVIHDFRQIIVESGVLGRAIAVECREWDRLITGPCRLLFGDAEGYCFRESVSFAIAQVQKTPA